MYLDKDILKKWLFLFFMNYLILFNLACYSQQITLNISSKDSIEYKALEKLGIQNFILDKNNINKKLDSINNQLHLNGFLNSENNIITKNDSVLNVNINLGKQFQHLKIINIYDSTIKNEIENILKTTFINSFEIKFTKVPFLLNTLVYNFEQKGAIFSQISLKNIRLIDNVVIAELSIKKSTTRTINKIVIKGYDEFPKSFIKHYLNINKRTVFNIKKLNAISNQLKSIPFVTEIKKPQTLFTKDSTHVYVYLKKKKTNQFDGLIGFNSKEEGNGINFTGYLDLHLENMFNYGAEIDLKWKSNGNENQKFNLKAKIPYVFNSPFSTKGSLQLYKQDSSYINIKTDLEIGYIFNSKNNIGVSIQNETSSNLLDSDNQNIFSDFKTVFYGLHYNYVSFSNETVFPMKYSAQISSFFGNRKTQAVKTSQTKLNLTALYNWRLNFKNYIYTQINNGYLISDDYLENELFRIGGDSTIRGFPIESIFASLYSTINIEYRYLTKNNAYLYSITDFGLVETEISKNKIFGLGIGYAFETKLGLLNLNYTIGKLENQNFDFSKAVVNLKYITTF